MEKVDFTLDEVKQYDDKGKEIKGKKPKFEFREGDPTIQIQ